MNVLFEEDGGFKAGTLLSDADTSLQVEMPSGKRSKIKSANVLLRFEKPTAASLIEQAQPMADDIEPDFLWECVNDGEFSFLDFARDYVGHEPSAIESTAVLLALQAAPIYFHRPDAHIQPSGYVTSGLRVAVDPDVPGFRVADCG